jgi:hypothetical protein
VVAVDVAAAVDVTLPEATGMAESRRFNVSMEVGIINTQAVAATAKRIVPNRL